MKAIIVGSGIAGIASGIRLAKEGFQVEIFEHASIPGGKLSIIDLNGFRFDTGPSLFTLPLLVDELFELCGKNARDYFSYQRLSETCRYFWEDGKKIAASAEIDQFCKDASNEFSISQDKLLNYFNRASYKYGITAPVFLDESLHLKKNYFRKSFLRGILNIPFLNLFQSMHQYNRKNIVEPHLVQLFDRFATYNGSNPFVAPGVLTMIPHLEHGIGAYFPKEGMYSIVEALVKLAKEMGVIFHFNTRVKKINTRNNIATSITVSGNKNESIVEADLVISNADVYSTYHHLLQDEKAFSKVKQQERSSSALIFYWGIKGNFEALGVHNILFSNDYKKEFEALFTSKTVDDDPTIYIHISSKIKSTDAPKDCENWFVMINVPGNEISDEQLLQYKSRVLNKIKKCLSIDVSELVLEEKCLRPQDIESKTSSHKGSLYGTSSNTRAAAFFRHPNFSKRFANIYFCGGSVHPGGGIPLALKSAKITAAIIKDQYAK